MTKSNAKTKNDVVVEETTEPKRERVEITLTKDQQKAYDEQPNISAKIRYLASEGFSTEKNKYGAIARFMGKRTQHVRNVLTQPLKKS